MTHYFTEVGSFLRIRLVTTVPVIDTSLQGGLHGRGQRGRAGKEQKTKKAGSRAPQPQWLIFRRACGQRGRDGSDPCEIPALVRTIVI